MNEQYYYNIECKNHKVCNGLLPDRWLDKCGRFLCIPCETTFGKLSQNNSNGILKFAENIRCLQCNKYEKVVSYPSCGQHYLCLDCFDYNWYSHIKLPSIMFPYNKEIENEYRNNPYDEKWNNYCLIQDYNKQVDSWVNLKQEIIKKCIPLRKCPICK